MIGAGLQYAFARSQEKQKHYRSLETEAFADYLRAVADAAHLNLKSDEAEVLARLADAKTRICLYGTHEVVTSLAAFEREGGVIGNRRQMELFLKLIQVMRGDTKVQDSDLEIILLGKERAT